MVADYQSGQHQGRVTAPKFLNVPFGDRAGAGVAPARRRHGAARPVDRDRRLLATWVPINKQLWTTSFAIFMSGLAATALACTIWLVDGRPLRLWFRPLEIIGMNAIAAYLISRRHGCVHAPRPRLAADPAVSPHAWPAEARRGLVPE
jgi:hypothetical protein